MELKFCITNFLIKYTKEYNLSNQFCTLDESDKKCKHIPCCSDVEISLDCGMFRFRYSQRQE